MAQDRKVFVGGVPQDLNQDDLYAIFSEHAGVKKAWLQKCRTADDSGNGAANPPQNHRGFGFVIFHDAHAIDEILGSAPSRFIMLRNGTKLEVKRALSSNKMSGPQATELAAPDQAGRPAAPRGQILRPAEQPPLLASGPRSIPTATAAPARVPLRETPPQPQAWAAAAAAAGLGSEALLRQLSLMQNTGGYPGVAPQGFAASTGPMATSTLAPAFAGQPTAAVQSAGRTPSEGRHAPLRNAIMQFYHEHRPEKLTERDFIDFICNVYEGREAELDEALRQKYGQGLQMSQSQALSQAQAQAKAASELASRQRAAATAAAVAAAAAAGVPGGFQTDPTYAGLQEAWLQVQAGAAAAAAATAAAAHREQQNPIQSRHQWEPTLAEISAFSALHPEAFEASKFHDEDASPDLSWVDQIVGDDGSFEISEEVARAIVGKSATKHRAELLQTQEGLAVW